MGTPIVESGATLVVVPRSGRNGLGVDLNDTYAAQAEQSILTDAAKRLGALV